VKNSTPVLATRPGKWITFMQSVAALYVHASQSRTLSSNNEGRN
jgi:hypothetical protein